VKRWLVSRAGVAEGRMTTRGFGPTRPVAPNASAAGRQANRRVEVRLRKQPPGQDSSQSDDGLLFEAVLQLLIADSLHGPVRVDPRPLRPDPRLVTLHAADIIPDRIEPGLWRDPISEATAEVRGREAILALLALERTDGLHQPACPGVLVPETAESEVLRRRWCPASPFRIAMVALPRQGGAYWPNNFDERGKYARQHATIRSVRVIVREYSAEGLVEETTDFVFAIVGSGATLLERRSILTAE
jgi:hypothetical protein